MAPDTLEPPTNATRTLMTTVPCGTTWNVHAPASDPLSLTVFVFEDLSLDGKELWAACAYETGSLALGGSMEEAVGNLYGLVQVVASENAKRGVSALEWVTRSMQKTKADRLLRRVESVLSSRPYRAADVDLPGYAGLAGTMLLVKVRRDLPTPAQHLNGNGNGKGTPHN